MVAGRLRERWMIVAWAAVGAAAAISGIIFLLAQPTLFVRAFRGIVSVAAATTLAALFIAGPGAHAAFIELLVSGGGVGPAFVGNTSLTLVSVPLAIAVGLLVGVAFLVVLLRRDQVTSWAAAPVLAIFAAATMVIGGQLYPVSGAVVLAVALLVRAAPQVPRVVPAGAGTP